MVHLLIFYTILCATSLREGGKWIFDILRGRGLGVWTNVLKAHLNINFGVQS